MRDTWSNMTWYATHEKRLKGWGDAWIYEKQNIANCCEEYMNVWVLLRIVGETMGLHPPLPPTATLQINAADGNDHQHHHNQLWSTRLKIRTPASHNHHHKVYSHDHFYDHHTTTNIVHHYNQHLYLKSHQYHSLPFFAILAHNCTKIALLKLIICRFAELKVDKNNNGV